MIEIRPSFDLPAFVQGVIEASSGRLAVAGTIAAIDREVLRTQRELSRDSHTRFQQIRYLNSLSRLQRCLQSHQLPADLTPRERLAFRALSEAMNDETPSALASALCKVTLPEGMFATGIAVHRYAT
jgi:hypothetical protein